MSEWFLAELHYPSTGMLTAIHFVDAKAECKDSKRNWRFHYSLQLLFFFFFPSLHFFIHLFTCAYIVWVITPSCPHPHPPFPSSQNLFCTFLQFHWRVEISNNKKDIAFLLVEIRTSIIYKEIPNIVSMYKCVTTQVDSSLTDLYTGSWSPSLVDLCSFKVYVLVPLEWGHQILSCFGFSIQPHTSRICSPRVM
jgi:hypothetical protein